MLKVLSSSLSSSLSSKVSSKNKNRRIINFSSKKCVCCTNSGFDNTTTSFDSFKIKIKKEDRFFQWNFFSYHFYPMNKCNYACNVCVYVCVVDLKSQVKALVPIVIWFEWSSFIQSHILCLFITQLGQVSVECWQVKDGYVLIYKRNTSVR